MDVNGLKHAKTFHNSDVTIYINLSSLTKVGFQMCKRSEEWRPQRSEMRAAPQMEPLEPLPFANPQKRCILAQSKPCSHFNVLTDTQIHSAWEESLHWMTQCQFEWRIINQHGETNQMGRRELKNLRVTAALQSFYLGIPQAPWPAAALSDPTLVFSHELRETYFA